MVRKVNSKGKKGRLVTCPKCGYRWRTKQTKRYMICCSNCKRYFKIKK